MKSVSLYNQIVTIHFKDDMFDKFQFFRITDVSHPYFIGMIPIAVDDGERYEGSIMWLPNTDIEGIHLSSEEDVKCSLALYKSRIEKVNETH